LLLHNNWLDQSLRNWRGLINHLSLHHLIGINSILLNLERLLRLHLLELLDIRLLIHHLLTILELVGIKLLGQYLILCLRLNYLLLIYWVLDHLWLFDCLLGHLLDRLLDLFNWCLINWLLSLLNYWLGILLCRLLNNLGCHLNWLFNSLSNLFKYRLLNLLCWLWKLLNLHGLLNWLLSLLNYRLRILNYRY
jgi:hypothetical protein